MAIPSSCILQRSVWRIKGTLLQMVGTVCFYLLYLIGKPVLDGVQGDIFLKEVIPYVEAKPRVYSVSPLASLLQ